MKLIVNIKLQTLDGQHSALMDTMLRTNEACNFISRQAYQDKTFQQFALHKKTYFLARERYELGSQMTCQCIAKVADAYKLSRHPVRKFKKAGAVSYHGRDVTLLKGDKVSIWTTKGRLKIPYVCSDRQRELLKSRRGEMDLILFKNTFYLNAVCDVPDGEAISPEGILGVDLGIVNIATDSDGEQFSGQDIDRVRQTATHRQRNLQRKGTKASKRKFQQIAGQQSRFQKNTNHVISKRIVEKAKGTNRSISLENLTGIRERLTVKKAQRQRLSNWAFYDLKIKIEYKAKLAGVPVIFIDPRNTSRECSVCGHISKSNRKSQSEFVCQQCGFSDNADLNASRNIRERAVAKQPNDNSGYQGSHPELQVVR